MAVVAGLGLLGGCTLGESDLTNPGSPRDLSNAPDTLTGPWTEDRIFRPALPSGNFVSLLLLREEGVHSELYARFDLSEFSDTSLTIGAELDLTVLGGSEDGVRLEAFLIEEAAGDWTEGELPTAGLPVASEPFFEGSSAIAPRMDDDGIVVSTVLGAVEVPREIVHLWQLEPERNRGIALRVAETNTGFLDFASSEAVLDTTTQAVSTTGLRLLVAEGQGPSTIKASDDAYRMFDLRPLEGPNETTLFVERQIPHRGLIRLDVESLLIPAGSTIHRAQLNLVVQPGSVPLGQEFRVGTYRNTTDWMIDVDPDSVDVDPVPTAIVDVDDETETASFDFGSVLQGWVDGEDNFGLTLRILGEGSEQGAVRFFSTDSDSSAPSFQIEYVTPPPPRWEDSP